MTTDDADLTIEVIPQGTYAGGVTEDWTAALIPGNPGAVVVASSWLGDYDWATGATWVFPADASGWVTTDSVATLGPEASYMDDLTFCVNELADAGDIDGDGENELYVGSGDLRDLYLGPLAPSPPRPATGRPISAWAATPSPTATLRGAAASAGSRWWGTVTGMGRTTCSSCVVRTPTHQRATGRPSCRFASSPPPPSG